MVVEHSGHLGLNLILLGWPIAFKLATINRLNIILLEINMPLCVQPNKYKEL